MLLRCHLNQVVADRRDVLLLSRDYDVQFGADRRVALLLPRDYVDGKGGYIEVNLEPWPEPLGRDRPERPPVEPRQGLRYDVVSADVLMQTFLHVCCEDQLLYYAASTAVMRLNRNFEINRYFTVNSLPYLKRAAATLQNPSFMLWITLLVLLKLCRTWCVRRCCLSVGFISPHLVHSVIGASMPQLACLLSSHLLRAHVQPQISVWAFDAVLYDMYLAATYFKLSATLLCGLWIP